MELLVERIICNLHSCIGTDTDNILTFRGILLLFTDIV